MNLMLPLSGPAGRGSLSAPAKRETGTDEEQRNYV